MILFLFSVKKEPNKLMTALQAYGLMVIFRTIAMSLTLEPPDTLLLLNDPFVQLFGKGEILTKDLFFSGHTGTLFLLFLLADDKTYKIIFLISTITVGLAVLLTCSLFYRCFYSTFCCIWCFARVVTNMHRKKLELAKS